MKTKFYFSIVAMVFAALTASAESFMYNGLAYNINGTTPTNVEVTTPTGGYTSLGGDITIPKTVYNNNKTYTVTSIGSKAFLNCAAITSIVIPPTVELIRQYAFQRCSGLKTVTFQDAANSKLAEIGYYAFSESGLTSITLPQSVKTLSDHMFYKCEDLTTASLPNGLTSCGSSTFLGCTSLKTVNIPTGLEAVPQAFLYKCNNVKSITIPSNIKKIGGAAFAFTGITSITIPSGVTNLGSEAFRACSGLTSITIPSSVTETENYESNHRGIFLDCTGLTSVNVQNSIIWFREFKGCTSLKNVTLGKNVVDIRWRDDYPDYFPFIGCPIENLTVSSNVAADIVVYGDSQAQSTLKTLTLNDGVTALPENAFAGCSALEKVTLPRGLESIGNSAFKNCTRMGDLIAQMPKPFAIDASVFSGVQQHGYCDLHVPAGSSGRYKAMEVWKEFYVIDEGAGPSNIRGDVNNDGQVTIADVVAVLNIMAGN